MVETQPHNTRNFQFSQIDGFCLAAWARANFSKFSSHDLCLNSQVLCKVDDHPLCLLACFPLSTTKSTHQLHTHTTHSKTYNDTPVIGWCDKQIDKGDHSTETHNNNISMAFFTPAPAAGNSLFGGFAGSPAPAPATGLFSTPGFGAVRNVSP